MLPLSMPALASLTLLTFVTTWNDYLGPFIYLTSNELWTIQLGLQVVRRPVRRRLRADHDRLGDLGRADPRHLPARAEVLRRGHRDERAEGLSTLSVTTYERGFRGLWTGLVVNLLLAVACSPLLLALVLVEDPLASLPFFAVLSCVCGPALMGAFGRSPPTTGRRLRSWPRTGVASCAGLLLWAGGAAVLGVLAVNIVGALSGDVAFARPLLPMFVVLAVLVVAVGSFSLVAVGHRPGVPFGELRRESAALAVRRWYLSALNVLVLAVLVAVLLVKPGIGVLIACAPLLYVVWSNAGYALTPQEDR